MKKVINLILILAIMLSTTACTEDHSDFNAPKLTKLNAKYKMYTLSAYNMILGFSPDAGTIVALKDDSARKGEKKLVLIDANTSDESGSVTVDPRWQIEQKRVRWSKGGSSFVLSDAWNSAIETRSPDQVPGYVIDMVQKAVAPFGEISLNENGNVLCSSSYGSSGESITYSVYNRENDTTLHYIKSEQPEDVLIMQDTTKGQASILEIAEHKYIESVESVADATDAIYYIDGEKKTNVINVRDAHRSLYIKDYCTDRRRILVFETSLVTEGTKMATERIIPKILEFDDRYEHFTLKEVNMPKKYEVLNGIMSPDGRYAVFIVYSDRSFIMVLYDANLSKSYELLKNDDIGSTFMGTMPGRVDGLFMSENRQICLVADNGVFVFSLE